MVDGGVNVSRQLHVGQNGKPKLPGAIDDTASGGIVGADGHGDTISQNDSDTITPHFSCKVGQDFESIVGFYFEQATGQHLLYDTFHLNMIFF